MTDPQFGTFIEPTGSGDDYKPRDNYGRVCIVKVNRHEPSVSTANGDSPAVFVDLVDLHQEQTYRNVMLMGGAFVDSLKGHVGGNPVVVQWDKRTSKAGREYAAPIPADTTAAAAYYAKHGDPFAQKFDTIDAEPPF